MCLHRCTECSYSALKNSQNMNLPLNAVVSLSSYWKWAVHMLNRATYCTFPSCVFCPWSKLNWEPKERREISKTKSCLQLCHLHSLFRFSFTSRRWNCLPLHTLSQLSSSFAAGRKCCSRADKGQSTLWLSLTQGKVVCSVEKLGTKIWQTVLQFDQISL